MVLQDGVDAERISKIVEKSLSSEGSSAVQVNLKVTCLPTSLFIQFHITDFLYPWFAVCH